MYYRNEGGRGIGEKKKKKEKDFHGTNGVQLVSQLSFISFFFFILLQMQIADYLPIVTLDRV